MGQIPEIGISDFSYDLPEEKIAVYPLSERDQSRLLVWKKGVISETVFTHADTVIPAGSLLVFNNTRVIHARVKFRTPSGAVIETFCLEPHEPADYQISFQTSGMVVWKCLVGNARKWKQGILTREVPVDGEMVTLQAEMTGRSGNAFLIRFTWSRAVTFATLIEAAGTMPIPPYLNRPAETIDDDRYQTTYALIRGSVAAPTAGLHFTSESLQRLKTRSIDTAELTLHVGAGTFQPVKTERVAEHQMHTETVFVNRSFLERLLRNEGRVIAVGTTSVRSLESIYWLGASLPSGKDKAQEESPGKTEPSSHDLSADPPTLSDTQSQSVPSSHDLPAYPPGPCDTPGHTTPHIHDLHANTPAPDTQGHRSPSNHDQPLHVSQWQPYTSPSEITLSEAISQLLTLMKRRETSSLTFTTSVIILPGYQFRVINGMFTNFHQPRSTLLLLIAAFLGNDWKKVYQYALQNGFRFLSYGDANLYLR